MGAEDIQHVKNIAFDVRILNVECIYITRERRERRLGLFDFTFSASIHSFKRVNMKNVVKKVMCPPGSRTLWPGLWQSEGRRHRQSCER